MYYRRKTTPEYILISKANLSFSLKEAPEDTVSYFFSFVRNAAGFHSVSLLGQTFLQLARQLGLQCQEAADIQLSISF